MLRAGFRSGQVKDRDAGPGKGGKKSESLTC